MVEIRESVKIAAQPERVWSILHDPEVVSSQIPGATLNSEKSPGVYEASMRVKFGPTIATFTGEATVKYDDEKRRCFVSGRGNDARGASPASGTGVVTVEGDETTLLVVDGSFELSGPLEAFAETGGVHVARALLAEFAINLAKLVEQRDGQDSSESEAPPPPSASPLSAWRLLRRIVASWLRDRLPGAFKGQK